MIVGGKNTQRIINDMNEFEDYEKSIVDQYIVSQINSGIKEGELVLVKRTSFSYEKGWRNNWTSEMDQFVGKLYNVRRVDGEHGITLIDSDLRLAYNFPYFILEKQSNFNKVMTTISVSDMYCEIELPESIYRAIQNKEKVTITNISFK
jgi:hypothetical protein